MATRNVIFQVKDRQVGSPDVQQLVGATYNRERENTILVLESGGASSAARREAERIERAGGPRISFWNIFGRR